MTDTMLSFANNQISNNFLSENDIMAKCPNAFKTEPTNPGVSDKYVQATTIDVNFSLKNIVIINATRTG